MTYFRYKIYMNMVTPMLYALRMMSTHHPTCPQLSGMACGALRDRGEALYSTLYGGPERAAHGSDVYTRTTL